MFKSVIPLSPLAKRYSLLLCSLIFGFMVYVFHAMGLFLAQNVFPENVSGFSVINPYFEYWNISSSLISSLITFVSLMAYQPFREYLYDAADELTRISWVKTPALRISTGIVLVTIFLSAIMLFLMDTLLGSIATYIISSATKS